MFVLRADLERLEDQKLFHVQRDGRRPLDQFRRDEDLYAPVLDGLIRRQVFALQVGVDRHLSDAVSGEGRDEVERHYPAALLRERYCFVRD